MIGEKSVGRTKPAATEEFVSQFVIDEGNAGAQGYTRACLFAYVPLDVVEEAEVGVAVVVPGEVVDPASVVVEDGGVDVAEDSGVEVDSLCDVVAVED